MKNTWLLDLALVAVVGGHLFLAPYTKVEESFNIQAIHDILNYGVFPASALEDYDHKTFPGVVPRTFVGSVVIAGIVKILDLLFRAVTGSSFVADGHKGQLHVQTAARAVLALANIWGFLSLHRSLASISGFRQFPGKQAKKRSAGLVFYTAMLLTQFHLMFYASRTLPNFVVLPLVNFGISKLVVGDLSGLTWLAFSGVVFRLEVGVLATAIAVVSSVIFGQSNLFQGIFLLAAGSLVGLVVTYSVDSYFWGSATVPELQAFFFNVMQGKSVEWGVEPYSAYFRKYIVNFFRPPHVLVLAVFGLLRDPVYAAAGEKTKAEGSVSHPARNSLRILGFSVALFVSLLSFQPHKEWRFVIYVAPVLTLLAGNGFAHIWYKPTSSYVHRLLVFLMIGSTVASFAISTFMAYASSFNYPGGAAIDYVNQLLLESRPGHNVTVHMDVPACMTGITRFTELHQPHLTFDKTESELALAKIWNDVDYLITHKNMQEPLASDLVVYDASHWNHLHSVRAFAGVNVRSVIRNIQLLVRDEKYRSSVVASVWAELRRGDFSTLSAFMKDSVILRSYLHIYKRTAPDAMPTILDFGLGQDENKRDKILEQEVQEQILNQISPEELQESVNEQIDSLEDSVEAKHLADEL